MLRESHRFFLPNLLTFTNGNTYLGSFMGLRFRVKPTEEELEDGSKRQVLACLDWYGEYCLEESEVVHETQFPLSAEGREQVIDWLEGEYLQMKETQPEETGPSIEELTKYGDLL